jgi:hypothetical protein
MGGLIFNFLGEDVSLALLNWIYTDLISFSSGDKFTLALMAAASQVIIATCNVR